MTLFPQYDALARAAAFAWLEEQVRFFGEVLPRTLLEQGYPYRGERIRLIGPQGIFKPASFQLPLSITTAPNGPYNDRFGPGNTLLYSYRGNNPHHRENTGLKTAMQHSVPLVHFMGLEPGRYFCAFPVYIVGADDAALTFTVQVDDAIALQQSTGVAEEVSGRRAYITSSVRRRVHQQGFRERVLLAYRQQCSICRLRHTELLDAAHITPDSDPDGEPVVSNGLSLCKLHHAAFDKMVLGVSPDYRVVIRQDVLEEIDGPMLRHGLVELHNTRIQLPRQPVQWPERERLERRYQAFLQQSA
jgi:putative restriction endonuclease